jgi:uncharacterized protein
MLRAVLALALMVAPTFATARETIFDAAAAGDTVVITRLLAEGTPVDSRGSDQATPLIAAALNNHADAARLLIEKGADVMARNSGGFTALHAAAYSGSLAVATLLVDSKAVLDDAENKACVTPLFVAAEMNRPELVEFLIAKGHGYSALTRAFWKGHTDMVSLLKRQGMSCQVKVLTAGELAQCLAIE